MMRTALAIFSILALASCGGKGSPPGGQDGAGGGGGDQDGVVSGDTGGGGGGADGAGGAVDIGGGGGNVDAGGGGNADTGGGGGNADAGGGGGNADAGGGGGNADAGGGGGNADAGGGGGNADAGGGGGKPDAGGGGNKPCSFDADKGSQTANCPAGEQCVVGVGVCAGKLTGICQKKANACPPVAAPVCGCDGKTYGNLCAAEMAGAVVEKGGACTGPQAPCGGIAGIGCPANQICEFDSCVADAMGVCVPAPPAGACPAGGNEECGCDGKTWPNACARQKAGVALKHKGACIPDPNAKGCKLGPVKPILCPADHYCAMTVAGACEGKGVCTPMPGACTKELKKVCGCDQITYSNACMANAAGWNVKAKDPCP